jgi:MFS family permease
MRGDLQAIMRDGLMCSVMVGLGENYLPAFALALGMGELTAGLIASVPFLAGAVLQLVSPLGLQWFGSHRRWVVACVLVQAASFIPLTIAAAIGSIPVLFLFLLAALYWGAGMASGPAWTSWVDTLIPERIRSRYFGSRQRVAQAGTLIGFVGGGLWLQFGQWLEAWRFAFAALFLLAAVSRLISGAYLASQREIISPSPPRRGQRLREIAQRLRSSGDGRLLVYLWAMQAAAQIASPFFAPFMLGQLKFSYTRYMVVIAVSLVAKAIALPTLGRLAQRFGAMRLLWVGGIIVIPMPLFWLVSHATPYLIGVQLLAGAAWATYELAALLLFFEAIDPHVRVGWLTIYNVGYAAATVGGSLLGGALLAWVGESSGGYFVVFAASCAARIVILPLLWRVKSTAAPQSATIFQGAIGDAGSGPEQRELIVLPPRRGPDSEEPIPRRAA